MRFFLRSCNFVRLFDAGFAKNAASFKGEHKKGEPSQFVLNDYERQRVEKLKTCLLILPVRVVIRTDGHYTVHTDAFEAPGKYIPSK